MQLLPHYSLFALQTELLTNFISIFHSSLPHFFFILESWPHEEYANYTILVSNSYRKFAGELLGTVSPTNKSKCKEESHFVLVRHG